MLLCHKMETLYFIGSSRGNVESEAAECESSSLLSLDAEVPHVGALRLHYSYGGGCDLLAPFSACIKREVRAKENTDGEG